MSMVALAQGNANQTLIEEYISTLGSMVGCLSRFIVMKQYGMLIEGGGSLDADNASTLTDLVVEEAAVLVGPVKADELKKRLKKVNEKVFTKEASD
jgi:hypothetical protein